MTEFRSGFLEGTSAQIVDPAQEIEGSYDLAVFAPSWDRRCLSILQAGVRIDYAIVLDFVKDDEHGLQKDHFRSTAAFAAERARLREILTIDALRLRESWRALWDRVQAYVRMKGRPLKILIDLTACPRFYSLGLVAGALRNGVAAKVTVFYAEGKYIHPRGLIAGGYHFSFGHWKAVPIPFLQGAVRPGRSRHYVVSVGFEGSKTARVLTKADPDKVSLLLPTPGVQKGYASLAMEQNERLVTDYRIGKQDIAKAHAADAVKGWAVLSKKELGTRVDEEVSFLCCGTKPHALALALQALCAESPAVLYNLPEQHIFVDVIPNGRSWRYDLVDVTSVKPL